jgi:hypothetical protein
MACCQQLAAYLARISGCQFSIDCPILSCQSFSSVAVSAMLAAPPISSLMAMDLTPPTDFALLKTLSKSSRYLALNFLLITILGFIILNPVSVIKAIFSLIFNNFLLFITTGLVGIAIYHYKKA